MRGGLTLPELQRDLESLFSPGGVRDRDAELSAGASRLPIGGDPRLSAAERLRIYQGAIFERILEAITEDFPASAASLAVADWRRLIASYLECHPTEDPSLRMAGSHLPAFLRRDGIAARPWQPDLADLEWAMVRAFDAAEERPLVAADLAALSPETWLGLMLRSSSSLVQLSTQFAVDEIRRALLAGEPASDRPDPCHLRVWRQDLRVYWKRIDSLEAEALGKLEQGLPFVELCEWLTRRNTSEDATRAALGLLEAWVEDQLLVAPPAR